MVKTWDKSTFEEALFTEFETFRQILSTDTGDWVIKGFIDVYRNIYALSLDTKVASKLIELMLFPIISQFAQRHGYELQLSAYQNHYPDISFIAPNGLKVALDLKSTYRLNETQVNGFTLGAFTGYFRDRGSTKNVTFAYQDYAAHFVLGVMYTRTDESIDERRVYTLDDLLEIASVIRDFQFVLHEKWQIASDHPGSGNTKNIGSVKDISALLKGNGTFAPYGEKVFDDYWQNYLTNDMALAIDSPVPYRNLGEYWKWRNRAPLKPGV